MEQRAHQSVLLKEAIEGLAIQSKGIYVDGTFGRGGHSQAILDRLSSDGQLFALDKDREAIKVAEALFGEDLRFSFYHGSFTNLLEQIKQKDLLGHVDGVLLDLGVSSPQLDDAARGFSFLRDGPLDMRMDQTTGMSAAEWLNEVKESTLCDVLKQYGEERFAKRIAAAIVEARKEAPIERTKVLAEIVAKAVPFREKHKHPATRTFQAIRIVINNELKELSDCLDQSLEVLKIGGRLVVISFHSLEDRIVKRFMKKEEKGGDFPAGLPVRPEDFHPRLKIVGRAIRSTEQEVQSNPRARSAVLRIAEKIA